MFAERIMTTNIATCSPDQPVHEVIDIMTEKRLHTLPVIDADGILLGSLNTLSVLNRIVPEYIVTGDLKAVPYAPDFGLLRKHYLALNNSKTTVAEVMERHPTTVHANESLLSVTAALITYDRFEFVIVIDDASKMLGIISSNDILRALHDQFPLEIETV
ncbi:MAG: CBS domain-containing protein [Mariprofundales bacterium]|nr:CBS domain-containing protein [Mariprofundales bacterium]